MFDIDNSGVIMVEEIHQSVQASTTLGKEFCQKEISLKAVWKILDGIGDAIDGTAEEISEFIFQKLQTHGKVEVRERKYLYLYLNCVEQVDLQDFVQLCLMDKPLGDAVLQIFRAVISK